MDKVYSVTRCGIHVCLLFGMFVSDVVIANAWEARSPLEDIRNTLSDERSAGWVITAKMDLDQDGDLDTLVSHEYLSRAEQSGDTTVIWLVYLNEDGEHFFDRKAGTFPSSLNRLMWCPIKASDGTPAIIQDLGKGAGKRDIVAVWFERDEEGALVRNMKRDSSSNIDSKNQKCIPEMPDNNGRNRWISASELFSEFRKLSKEEARKIFSDPE